MDKDKKYNIQDIDIQACSTMDCTGLIPSPPQSEAELDSYEDLYPFLTKAIAASTEKQKKENS